jgi:hypothetical protein
MVEWIRQREGEKFQHHCATAVSFALVSEIKVSRGVYAEVKTLWRLFLGSIKTFRLVTKRYALGDVCLYWLVCGDAQAYGPYYASTSEILAGEARVK